MARAASRGPRVTLGMVFVIGVTLMGAGTADAQSQSRADLVMQVRTALGEKLHGGEPVSFYVTMGATRLRASVLSCDEGGVTARIRGSVMRLPWQQTTPKDLLSLGSRVLEADGATHLLRARVCLEAGLEAAAVAEFEKMPAFGWDIPPDGARLMQKRASARPTTAAKRPDDRVTIQIEEYPGALRNPLKGFRHHHPHPYATLHKTYIKWNELENDVSDGPDRIRAFCDKRWRQYAEHNLKVIPRVWLYMPPRHAKVTHNWPADMTAGDYSSEQFVRRVKGLVRKLGECWDTDPRVAYVEMGIIGKWGEQHSPEVTPKMQVILGDAFTAAFKNKLVMVRHAADFKAYHFGVYWDSWAHTNQMKWTKGGGAGIAALGDRWRTAVMGGETAYDWGAYQTQPGDDPNDTLSDPTHRDHLINTIRWLHCNHLGWVAGYDAKNPTVCAGAQQVQKALGYRFVINEVRLPRGVMGGERLKVGFVVRNTGSTPLYYNWPLEVSLLHPRTREPVWKATFENVDTRSWMPGDAWDESRQCYAVPARRYLVQGSFEVRAPAGQYALALAILDPDGMLPSVRFAIKNYWKGGRHPVGCIGVGSRMKHVELDPATFDDPQQDDSLGYVPR